MIAEELIAELEKVQHLFEWNLVPDADSGWRPNRRSQRRTRIRATLKDSSDGLVFEPIGAVCFARTGRAYPDDCWMDAAHGIGLSLIDAADLTAAGNDVTYRKVNGSRGPDPYIRALREKLAASVGLGLPSLV